MARLRDLFPVGQAPFSFSERYKMIKPEDYAEIFREIKNHVKRRQTVMVSEGNSVQSAPAIEGQNINNNQTGETIDLFSLI